MAQRWLEIGGTVPSGHRRDDDHLGEANLELPAGIDPVVLATLIEEGLTVICILSERVGWNHHSADFTTLGSSPLPWTPTYFPHAGGYATSG